MDYLFTLKYQLAEFASDMDELVERLGAAGCDDSLIGLGTPGRIALEFTRDAPDARTAMVSALEDVKRAIPTARLIEASPDYVGLSDVAELVGVTRQNMRKLMVNSSSFPIPVHEGSAAVWHLADVLIWLDAKGNYKFERSILEVAKTAMLLNFAKESRQQVSTIPHDIWELTA
ncbi:MAG TPA: DNA-binding protein [Telluria sp.]|nr:DNA-binding protein [Telluria sp.]